jgi:diguanylate cyclase (GGDEF)-like protein/PAS domain S-box-containing protein
MPNYLNLITAVPSSSLLYEGRYDALLVMLSVVVAIFASYAALLVSQHASGLASGARRRNWLMVGGLCLGLGIWAMHFVGMLAFTLPCTSSYDYRITLLSTLPGILASTMALSQISHRDITGRELAVGGLLLGAGIGTMHYSGMAAMRLDGFIQYDLKLFLLSIVVAVALATLALWTKFRLMSLRAGWRQHATLIGACVMGLAVAGMHYTAMAAAHFIRAGENPAAESEIGATFLATIVLFATSLIIVITIVATYVGKHKLFSFERSYKLVGLVTAGWIMVAWLSANYFHERMVRELDLQESAQARQQASDAADNIAAHLQRLKGIPVMLSRDEAVRSALRRQTPVPQALNQELKLTAQDLDADALWIVDANGICIASSNAGTPTTFIGTNYADRTYFKQARAGGNGQQYAIGRTSNVAGLYYSTPIFEGATFTGAVVVKRNVSRLAAWTGPARAFLSDANGVIVQAADARLEFRTLPQAAVNAMTPQQRLSQYRRERFDALRVTPWGEAHFPAAVRIGDDQAPVLISSAPLTKDAMALHVARPLPELARLSTERLWLFLLIALAGSMLIVAASSMVLYLRASNKVEADLRVAATAFEAQEGMVITDAGGTILRINRAFTDITGYTDADAVDRQLDLADAGRHDAQFCAGIWQAVRSTGAWQGEIWNRRKSGESFPEWLTITAVRDAGGHATHYVCTLTDITRRKADEEEIRNLALYDCLTTLPNRRCLMERLEHAIRGSERSGQYGALLFIDLDNFKDLNDTLGHNMGDLLLQQTAQRFVSSVRSSDTVARLGGDEFIVMLEDLGTCQKEAVAHARETGEKILRRLNDAYALGDHDFTCSASIGVTVFQGHDQSVAVLLKQTDLAMYQAKAAGRNAMRFFEPSMQEVVTIRATLDADLRLGLQHGQFRLYYQPQVDAAERVTGAEVLLRWLHPQRGLVHPLDFIAAAEESGLILPLGRWVMETACAQLAAWAAQPEMAHLTVAVNVSPLQFRQPDFVEQVNQVLVASGANPRRLKLELTETMLLDDVEQAICKMAALKVRGVNFALDDFGTGYSSLSYLQRLPISQLKIDRSFVRDILNSASDAAITRTIISLAHTMGLAAIAEGVETPEQFALLAELGCDAYQGYWFGRPMPVQAFESILQGQQALSA